MMNNKKKIDIFISYSSGDSQIAHRLYEDLLKRGAKPYLYEKQRNFVEFMEEISDIIKQVKSFCLLDSPQARDSSYVKTECELALKSSNIKNDFFLF
ncbi:MAG: toll/interleukin-1 receptor domain-containing protein [Flavobacteriaceae bacterium]